MKLLIDTNVLLDMVLKRNGYDISMKLFRKIREQKVLACITASSVTDLFISSVRKRMTQNGHMLSWKTSSAW
ncbi:MAG: PIN domain-containing protein [Lachnospiraceae bacterium]|nr:PIN domain-containing protein [Lachnospiraceae bacterium]